MQTLSAKENWRFSYRVLLPIILAVFFTVAAIVSFIVWTAERNDKASVSRQIKLVAHILEQQKNLIKEEQADVVAWDRALKAVQDEIDFAWIDANLGKGMKEFFGHDRTFLLNPKLIPIYAMADGKTASPELFEASRAVIEPLAQRLKEINWQGALSLYVYGHSGVIPNIVDVVKIENKPAIISLMPIASDKRVGQQRAGKEFIHISIEFLDDELAKELYEQLLLEGGYFSEKQNAEEGEVMIPVKNLENRVITNFFWQPESPGADLFKEIAPALIAVALFASLIITILVIRLYQSTAKLERERMQAQHLAYHDALTGLGNRAKFELSLSEAINELKNDGNQIALLILDLDRFKLVNDTLGHQAGDELIREVAKRLRPLVRSTDIITRLGGDEFAIIVKSVTSHQDIEAVCARMVNAIRQPFNLEAGQAFVGVSIGVSIAENSDCNGEELTRQADIALYEAKESGRNQYKIFEDRMN